MNYINCIICTKQVPEPRRARRHLTCGDECATKARECIMCAKPIPEHRHHAAKTCDHECAWLRERERRSSAYQNRLAWRQREARHQAALARHAARMAA